MRVVDEGAIFRATVSAGPKINREELTSSMTTETNDYPEIPDSRDDLELSRSNTQQSLKCQSCGAMFDASEHMERGAVVCPVCRQRQTNHPGQLQSTDQGF